MPIAKINHVALKVSDLEAATRFYENVFGFVRLKPGARAAMFRGI
jgi:catechol 2,3-dioxygenase-like lactoylglutathione lyase family enzyme